MKTWRKLRGSYFRYCHVPSDVRVLSARDGEWRIRRGIDGFGELVEEGGEVGVALRGRMMLVLRRGEWRE